MELETFISFVDFADCKVVKLQEDFINRTILFRCFEAKSVVHPQSIVAERVEQERYLILGRLIAEMSESGVQIPFLFKKSPIV